LIVAVWSLAAGERDFSIIIRSAANLCGAENGFVWQKLRLSFTPDW